MINDSTITEAEPNSPIHSAADLYSADNSHPALFSSQTVLDFTQYIVNVEILQSILGFEKWLPIMSLTENNNSQIFNIPYRSQFRFRLVEGTSVKVTAKG